MTVLERLQRSTEYLKGSGISNPRTSSELLLAFVLGVKRLDLYLDYDRELTEIEEQRFGELCSRRYEYEPVQYIIGETECMSLPFYVDDKVLIPRPETELLIEQVIAFCNRTETDITINILEIGVGSGNIAVSLAHYVPEAQIEAIDISRGAVEIAQKNAVRNNVETRINIKLRDVFELTGEDYSNYHVVIANPPYVEYDEKDILEREVIDYEPHSALFSEDDGLKFYRVITDQARHWLHPGGMLAFETAYNRGGDVVKIVKNGGFHNVNLTKDYAKYDRIVTGIK